MSSLALSFDDVLVVPAYSTLSSRNGVSLESYSGWELLKTPIIASPMDSVTGIAMMRAMKQVGGSAVHHRYCSMEELTVASRIGPVAVSPSMGIEAVKNLPGKVMCLDLAHGDSQVAVKMAVELRKAGKIVISGNLVTPEAAQRYWTMGITVFRVGVGGGASCSTRVVAGIGYPQLSAIIRIRKEFPNATIISDGGIRNSGDVVKALAGGADVVMLGRLLGGTKEALGKRRFNPFKMRMEKVFRGMASNQALREAGKEINEEGISTWIPIEGPVSTVVDRLNKGIRAGLAYVGARDIRELRQKTKLIRITHAGYIEGLPRG